jgi:hypothetical protein
MAFCIIIDLFMAYKYPISDVFGSVAKNLAILQNQ